MLSSFQLIFIFFIYFNSINSLSITTMDKHLRRTFSNISNSAWLLICFTLIGLLSSCDSRSNYYQPSKEIVNALESGSEALSFCQDGQDSFYVLLVETYELDTKLDSVLFQNNIDKLKQAFDDQYLTEIKAKYYGLLSKSKHETNERIDHLKKSYSYYSDLNSPDQEEPLSLIINHYSNEGDVDSTLKYANTLDQKIKDSVLELSFENQDLLGGIYRNSLLYSKSLDHVDVKIDLVKQSENIDSLLLSQEYFKKGILCFNLHEFELSEDNYRLASKFLPKDNNQEKLHLISNQLLNLINAQEFDKADLVFAQFEELEQTNLVQFRKFKLRGMQYYKMAEDSVAVEYFNKASLVSKNSAIDSLEILDAQVTWIESLFYLGDLMGVEKVLTEVEESYDLTDLSNLLTNPVLQNMIVSKLRFQSELANNRTDIHLLEQVVENINVLSDKIDQYSFHTNEEDTNNLNQVYLQIYGLKFLNLFRLHSLLPNNGFDINLLQSVEREKGLNIFFRKHDKFSGQQSKLLDLYEKYTQTMFNEDDNVRAIRDSLTKLSPIFGDLLFGDGKYFLKQAKQYCALSNSTILEFITTYRGDWVLQIDEFDIKVYELEKTSSINNYDSLITKIDTAFNTLNKNLYNDYFKPIEPFIKTENVVIVSESLIDNISFGSFVSDITHDYLVNDYNFMRAYSIKNLLLELNDTPNWNATNKMIAYSYSNIETIKAQSDQEHKELQSAYEECLQLKNKFASQVDLISGMESTKDHFLKEGLQYGLIHLAMHGSGNENSVKKNHIFFRGENPETRILNSEEIEDLKLNNSLLVLNACQTNAAREIVNQGNQSMARSFAAAGVQNIITSTIPIDDKSSQKLILEFYQELKKGKPISMALTNAKRYYLNSKIADAFKHPYYWSSMNHYSN